MKPARNMPLGEMMLRQSPGCSWLLDREGVFQAVYGDATRVFGCPAAELENRKFADALKPALRSSWAARLGRVFAGEAMETTGRFGAEVVFFVRMFPVRLSEGEIAYAGCTTHDMPEGGRLLRTLDGLEAERTRLAELLHDRVAQRLSAAGLQLDLVQMDLADGCGGAPRRITEIQESLEALMSDVRDVNRDLYPATAGRIGLRAALDGLAGLLRTSFPGNVRVLVHAKAQPAPAVAEAMYRIAQEAAAAAVKRAGCSALEILVKSGRNGAIMEVRDNGTDAGGPERGAWLESLVMQHFAERAGIDLEIDSIPGKGTVVRALFPATAAPVQSASGD